jgi:hypothetical protein
MRTGATSTCWNLSWASTTNVAGNVDKREGESELLERGLYEKARFNVICFLFG